MAGRLWLCQLMSVGMLVRPSSGGAWAFVLALVSDSAVLAWRAQAHTVCGKVVYMPVAAQQEEPPYLWLVVVDPRQWVAHRIDWVGDCWRLTEGARAARSSASSSSASSGDSVPCGLKALPKEAAPIPLLKAAAHMAFKGMSHQALLDLARLMDIP
eukprot:3878875-Heterocapsa_arctica.AAC.1